MWLDDLIKRGLKRLEQSIETTEAAKHRLILEGEARAADAASAIARIEAETASIYARQAEMALQVADKTLALKTKFECAVRNAAQELATIKSETLREACRIAIEQGFRRSASPEQIKFLDAMLGRKPS